MRSARERLSREGTRKCHVVGLHHLTLVRDGLAGAQDPGQVGLGICRGEGRRAPLNGCLESQAPQQPFCVPGYVRPRGSEQPHGGVFGCSLG